MSRMLPGTRALRTLEAAGRHLNFTRAADELGLTPAAVSYQIKEIEDQLGVTLFIRTSRSIRLTSAGTVLLEAASESLDLLGRATARARKMQRGTALLRITLEATFASRWLMPRLTVFRRDCPEIELGFDVSEELRDFELDDVDAAIRFGAGKYPGLRTHRLFENVIIPVCNPGLVDGDPPLRHPRDLLNHTLCDIDWSLPGMIWPNWQMWMAAAGIEDFDNNRRIVFDDSAHAVQAAIQGNAVALVELEMVASDLAAGKLVRPFDLAIRTSPEFAYYLVYPEANAEDPRIVRFRDWILSQAGKTGLAMV